MATTIQISSEEDHEITLLKNKLGFPSKKAVIMEGVHTLQQILQNKERASRLANASLKIRKESKKANQIWAPLSTATRIK